MRIYQYLVSKNSNMKSSFIPKRRKYTHLFLYLLLCTKAFGGISFFTCYSKQDAEIDLQIRSEISRLNTKLVTAIFQQNPATVVSMMSAPMLLKVGTSFDVLVPQIASVISSPQYSTQLEYHSICSKPESPLSLPSGKSSESKYILSFSSATSESYVSVFALTESITALVVYGKYDSSWQINILNIGNTKIGHLSGQDYFKLAKSRRKSKNILDAKLYSSLANQLMHPFSKFLSYDIQEDVDKFRKSINTEAKEKYKFPIPVRSFSSTPAIFDVIPYAINDTAYPMIRYTTKISLDDTTELRKEYEMVKSQIPTIFPDLYKDRKAVLYRAFTKTPDGTGSADSYGFSDRLKQ